MRYKNLTLLVFILLLFASPVFCIDWNVIELDFSEEISDGIIADLDGDGLRDILILSGRHIYIYRQSELGFRKNPDDRIYYKQIGETIDTGEINPNYPGSEIIGISENGVKYFYFDGKHYKENPVYFIRQKIERSFFRIAPVLSDFAFDINGDGLDELLLFYDNDFYLYINNGNGSTEKRKLENTYEIEEISLNSRILQNETYRSENKNIAYFFHPEILTTKLVDFYNNNFGYTVDSTLKSRQNQTDLSNLNPFFDEKYRNMFFDINGDNKVDKVLIEINDDFYSDLKFFPYVKYFLFLNINNQLNKNPDYFFKSTIVNNHPPFIDLENDGDLDFISIWSDLSLGSKENMIQIMTDSVLKYTLRLYRYINGLGYSKIPDISMTLKIKYANLSSIGSYIPIDFSGDFNDDGNKDLCVRINPETLLIYLMTYDTKRINISGVFKISIPKNVVRFTPMKINDDNKSDILLTTENKIILYLSN